MDAAVPAALTAGTAVFPGLWHGATLSRCSNSAMFANLAPNRTRQDARDERPPAGSALRSTGMIPAERPFGGRWSPPDKSSFMLLSQKRLCEGGMVNGLPD